MADNKMIVVTWEVSDGYSGGSAPQHTYIPEGELEGLDAEERGTEIHAWVQQDFEAKVSWSITNVEEPTNGN